MVESMFASKASREPTGSFVFQIGEAVIPKTLGLSSITLMCEYSRMMVL